MPFKFDFYVWNSPFTFISPLDLEECVRRLRDRHERPKFFSLKERLIVRVDPLDDDAFQFKMQREQGRDESLTVVGVLERREDGTLVSGVSRFNFISVVLLTIVLMIVVDATIVPKYNLGIVLALGLDLLLAVLFLGTMFRGCHALKQLLFTLLLAPELRGDVILTASQPSHLYKVPRTDRVIEMFSVVFFAVCLVAVVVGFSTFNTGNN